MGGSGNWALLTNVYAATSLDLNGFILTKTGANTIALVNTTTTAGTVQVSNGILALGVTENVNGVNADASAVTLDNTAGASLSVVKNSSLGSLAGGGTTGGNVVIANAITLLSGALNTPTSYGGVISGAGAFTKTGTEILTLTNTHTYTGITTISGGILQIGNNGTVGQLPASSVTSV